MRSDYLFWFSISFSANFFSLEFLVSLLLSYIEPGWKEILHIRKNNHVPLIVRKNTLVAIFATRCQHESYIFKDKDCSPCVGKDTALLDVNDLKTTLALFFRKGLTVQYKNAYSYLSSILYNISSWHISHLGKGMKFYSKERNFFTIIFMAYISTGMFTI